MNKEVVKQARDRLRNLLSWSDRIGSDEINEIELIINKLNRWLKNE